MDDSIDSVDASVAAEPAARVVVSERTTARVGGPLRRTGLVMAESVRRDPPSDTQVETADFELELVRRAQAGDEQAFGQLVERNRRAVYRAAYAALGSADEADDVAQDTFVTVYQKLDGFRGEASFRTWLLAIAWRKALDRRRSVMRWLRLTATRARGDEDPLDAIERVRSPLRSQEEGFVSDELHRRIRQLIRTLPRKLRDALLLAGSGDYSYEQIGRMLEIPVGTVKWRVAEARRLLRKKLRALGYGND